MSNDAIEGTPSLQQSAIRNAADESPEISIKVDFGGGLEILFANQRSYKISIPAKVPVGSAETKPADVSYLLLWLRDNLLKERVELFLEGETIRPGILILINDSDWELEGEGDYQLKAGDEIVFISTLHGG